MTGMDLQSGVRSGIGWGCGWPWALLLAVLGWDGAARLGAQEEAPAPPVAAEEAQAAKKPTPRQRFQALDQNQDRVLSADEFVAGGSEEQRARRQRDWQVVDWNGDGRMSLNEFRGLPEVMPLARRPPIPDPIAALANERMEDLQSRWATWDTNEDGDLDADEFTAARPDHFVPGLEGTDFSLWDADDSGRVTPEEAARVVRVAYGLETETGDVLRSPGGGVFNLRNFRRHDANGDGRLDAAELVSARRITPDEAAAWLARLDANRDGTLAPPEMERIMVRDALAEFLAADTNFDGRLSDSELLELCQPFEREFLVQRWSAFDLDRDGGWSLAEFRQSPLGLLDESWHQRRIDRDGNGLLELAEFRWNRPLQSRAVTALVFDRLDRSRNGTLEPDELDFAPPEDAPTRAFRNLDLNSDGRLDLAEFMTRETNRARQERDFRVFDLNGDGRLTWEEYRAVPSRHSPDDRRLPVDPLTALARAQQDRLAAGFAQADRNHDGRLNPNEFRDSRITRNIPGLQLSRFIDWDLDGDGTLTREELRQVMGITYGLHSREGIPYRTAAGTVVNVAAFVREDENADRFLSREEYRKLGRTGSTAETLFTEADIDGDDRLSFREWCGSQAGTIDPVMEFLRFDTDLNGRLSLTEIQQGLAPPLQTLAARYIPAFDDDRDGELSLAEYLLVPTVNRFYPWPIRRRDEDHDGCLSFSEFFPTDDLEARGLAHEYFRRFDRNHDGRLDGSEFDFRIDVDRVPPQVAFAHCDVNHDDHVTLDELLADARTRTGPAAAQGLVKLEEFFLASDKDGNGQLSLIEFMSGRAAREDLQRRGRRPGRPVARGDEAGWNVQLWGVIGFNVLLLGGIAWYVLRRS